MKVSFGHQATTSFTLWFEHHLLEHGEAYKNMTGKLFYIDDERLPVGHERYSSAYKQWITESGVGNGGHVPDNFSGAGAVVNRSDPGMGYYVDFNNGGIVVTGAAANPNMQWSGAFGLKEFNIYNTNQTEESLIVESKFETNSRFTVLESGIAPYDFVTPAVFINNEYIENEPYAFGGEDKTVLNFKSVVMAENLYQLDGVLSLFADTRNVSFSNVGFDSHPINEYGDLKSGAYSYNNLATTYKNDIFSIERVTTSKISETMRSTISPTLYVGFIDFEVTNNRFPRVC
tara:strand:- start:50 stop:913 length:864 start_codon:yes stop_codon:yes gene_type:complete